MTTPSEEEARAAAEAQFPDDEDHVIMTVRHMKRDGFVKGYLAALASRVSTPPSEDALLVEVKLGREYEPPNWEGSEPGGWFAHVESARVVSGNLTESVRALAEPYSSELDYDERVQEAVAEYIGALPAVPVLPTEPAGDIESLRRTAQQLRADRNIAAAREIEDVIARRVGGVG